MAISRKKTGICMRGIFAVFIREMMLMKKSALIHAFKMAIVALWLAHASAALAWGLSLETISSLMEQDTINRMMEAQEHLRHSDDDDDAPARPVKKQSPLDSGNWLDFGKGRFNKDRGFAYLAGQYGMDDDYNERKWYFKELALDFNHTLPELWNVPMNNLATGMAALVASGYSVYTGQRVEAAWMQSVFRQIEAMMLKNAKITRMDYSEKGYLYQLMICMAMDLQKRAQQAPTAELKAQWREMGGQILSTVLHAPPEKIRLGPQGIAIRR